MPLENGGNGRYKPVGHHLLDVAAVVDRYLAANPSRLRRESTITRLSPQAHGQLCTVLAALHDLGKISPWFQAQAPALWPSDVLGALPLSALAISHWQASAVLLDHPQIRRVVEAKLPEVVSNDQIIAAIAGHHGRPPGSEFLGGKAGFHGAALGEVCIGIAGSLCAELLDLLVPEPITFSAGAQIEAFSFSLNGLVTLADWVGSDTDIFTFEDPQMPLAAYWPLALARAQEALRLKGLLPAKAKSDAVLSALSPRAGRAPRPMQAVAAQLPIGPHPHLIIIEDGTGSGKTEAALLFAARMIAAGHGEGVYVALPTMATANAMHGRLEAAMHGLFEETPERPSSLVLAHGKAALAMALDHLAGAAASGETGHGGREEVVSEWFNAWIGDSRKKAFFADAGAGTIDQAFLAVLPKKHLTLRQYALAGRVLIIDEAHACDAYMSEELKTLVEMHARLGGSVIILSATLGEMMRRELILAFARGRGLKDRSAVSLRRQALSPAYPLLTHYCEDGGLEELPVEALASLARSVEIARLEDRAASLALALNAAGRGGAVAIICNAVDAAIAVHEALALAGHPADRLTLFHARFVTGDRMDIEERVLQLFGPESQPQARAGQILVATQVVEQSLDLDFDVMISDLAPVDLLIQRAGRLWRHRRTQRPLPQPVLHIVSPQPSITSNADWLKETLGPAAYTYPLPGVLWRTARDLFSRGRLQTPDDLRQLVEAAYRREGDDLPQALCKPHEESIGMEYAAQSLARYNAIDPKKGYAGLSNVSADEDIGTRLGEKSVTLRLARPAGATFVPLVCRQGASEAVNWALSEITVRYRWLAGKGAGEASALPVAMHAATLDTVRATWPEWEQTMPLYALDDDGRLLTAQEHDLRYHHTVGLKRHTTADQQKTQPEEG